MLNECSWLKKEEGMDVGGKVRFKKLGTIGALVNLALVKSSGLA